MKDLKAIQDKYIQLGIGSLSPETINKAMRQAGQVDPRNSERGVRASYQDQMRYQYQYFGIDPAHRAKVSDIRVMDEKDGRVKKIHGRMARSTTKGGLLFKTKSTNKRLINRWKEFVSRLDLDAPEKLESDSRGLVMEGNLILQWVLDHKNQVAVGIRMPSDTIVPRVNQSGRFKDVFSAFEQWDYLKGRVIETFPLWQLGRVRLSPHNYDDMGSLGRPYLDGSRTVWSQLMMTEENLVIRRDMRAPLRMSHVLEGATEPELDNYRERVEADQASGNYSDYYLNKKGAVTALQGDENLDQIADVAYLLDTFFSGAPAPKGLFGYSGELKRDILEDLKKDYFEEIDALQDTQAHVYEAGFRLTLLLAGINPDAQEFKVQFAERRTDSPNQRADLGLKYQALGVSKETILEVSGVDPVKEKERLNQQVSGSDPYPDILPEEGANGPGQVNVTPGNQRKGESATTVSTRSK